MGLLMGAIAGAAGAVEDTTKYALRSMMDEEKAKRIAEYGSKLKSDEDLTTRARNKGDAADERARVAEFSKPKEGFLNATVAQAAENAGLTSSDAIADENPGYDAQKRTRPLSDREAARNARDAGDIKSATEIGKLDDKDAANAIKLEIAKGKFESALQIAQMKGEFAMMLGELKAAAANGSGKATELMRNWEYLKGKGKTDAEAGELLLSGKVGEYTTTATETYDDKGNKTVTTKKVKPGTEKPAQTSGRVRVFVPGKGFVDQPQ